MRRRARGPFVAPVTAESHAVPRPAAIASPSPDGGGDVRPSPSRPARSAALAALLLAATAACAGRRAPDVETVEPGWSEEGTASWYGPGFHGRPTASGETFDMDAMTAAHPSLPLGTRVRVTVLETGRNTVVRVNDRGPFVDDRIVDVSRAAARRLGFLEAGTARVRVEVVEAPPEDCWAVQVGSYREEDNARSMRRQLERAGEPARLEPGPRGFTRVVAGPYDSRRDALRLRGEWGGVLRGCGDDGSG